MGNMNDQNLFGDSTMNSMAAQMVTNMAKGRAEELYETNKGWLSLDIIKDYFDVTNRYVLNKLRIIILPITITNTDDWKRQGRNYDYNQEGVPSTPRQDLQAPDLYIPLMSFVTFILLLGCFKAVDAQVNDTVFDMEALMYVYSKSLFIWVFEAVIQKGTFVCLNIANPAFLELLAYTGYKFVILCIVVMADGMIGYTASYVAFFMFGALFALFFYQTLRRFSLQNTLADHIKDVSMNRKTFMLANCALQVLIIWLLSYN